METTAFNNEQFDSIYPPGIENHYWNHCRNRIIYDVLKNHSLDKKNILEIGCGKGIVVEYLVKKKLRAEGCELAPVTVNHHLKDIIFTGTDALHLPENKRNHIDVILLLDVIEHIEKPETFLQQIVSAFPNATHFLVTVPACPELWSNYDEFNGHFRRYDPKMLKGLAKTLNMKIQWMQYLFHLLYLPAFLLKLTGKKRNTNLTAPKGVNLFFHRILSVCFFFEYKFLFGNIKGTSLLTLLKI